MSYPPRTQKEMELIQSLAEQFAKVLQEWIGKLNLEKVNVLNQHTDFDEGSCATHDFCDANMAMDAAFQDVYGREPVLDSNYDNGLWSEAWDQAKRQGFYLENQPGKGKL